MQDSLLTKKCTKCKKDLPATVQYFQRDVSKKNGFRSACKKCSGVKKYYLEIIKSIEGFKICTKCKQKLPSTFEYFQRDKNRSDGLYPQCKKCRAKSFQEFKKNHPEKYKLRNQKSNRKVQESGYLARYNEENREKARLYALDRRKNHKEAVKKSELKRNKKRRANLKYKLGELISSGMRHSLKLGGKCGHKWESIVGYTADDLKKHLEKHFKPGMTWENRGRCGWHVDHKTPVDAFNFKTIYDEDFKKCWALNNLQPLWESENCSKQNKLNKHFQPSLLLKHKHNI